MEKPKNDESSIQDMERGENKDSGELERQIPLVNPINESPHLEFEEMLKSTKYLTFPFILNLKNTFKSTWRMC